jgi:hypothetical protein
MMESHTQASGVMEAPLHAIAGNAEANAQDQISADEALTKDPILSTEQEEMAARIKQMVLEDLIFSAGGLSQQHALSMPSDSPGASGTNRIEIRASSHFTETLDNLCITAGLTRANVIQKGVALYARALLEKSRGRVLSIAALEDNQIKIMEIIQV